MARKTQQQREAEHFRDCIRKLLAEPDDWENFEHIRYWLRKLLHPDHGDVFTDAERAAVLRVTTARTPFDGWDGHTVPELIKAALNYAADFDYPDEEFLKALDARKATRLVLPDMGHLVGLCEIAGMDIERFRPFSDAR